MMEKREANARDLSQWRTRLMNCMGTLDREAVDEKHWIAELFDSKALDVLCRVSRTVCQEAVIQIRGGIQYAIQAWTEYLKNHDDESRFALADAWVYLCERIETGIEVIALHSSIHSRYKGRLTSA